MSCQQVLVVFIFDRSLQLYEGLAKDLNYNVMLSQGSMLTLGHSRHDMDMLERWSNALQLQGVDAEMMTPQQIKAYNPAIDFSDDTRYPIWGGFIQQCGGLAHHDAVAWGYA